MAESMIERVADAIYNAASGPECLGISDALAKKFARAALEAMREPTEAIIKAHHVVPDDNNFDERTRSNWQAMIDAALTKDD